MKSFAALATASLVLAQASPAQTAASTVSVKPKQLVVQAILLGDKSKHPALRDIVESVAAVSEGRPQLSSLTVEDAFSNHAAQRSEALTRCGSDTECLGRTLATWNVDLGLLVIADSGSEPASLDLLLLPAGSSKALERRSLDVEADAPSILRALRSELEVMFDRANFKQRARIDIQATPASATIQLNGPQDALLVDGSYYVPEGEVAISVMAPGFVAQEKKLQAVIGQDQRAEFTLKADDSGASTWLWVGLGAGAAAVAAAAVVIAVTTRPGPVVCIMDAQNECP